MASAGSSSQGRSRAAGAPPADNAHHASQPSLNPKFVAMPATELIAKLKRHRRAADFANAALVFAARERRLAEAEQLVRVGNKRVDRLLEEIKERDAQIQQAAVTVERLQAEIRALQQAREADAKQARPLQQARAADAKQARPLQPARAAKAKEPPLQQARAANAKVRLPKTRYRALRMNASSPAFPSSGDESDGFDTYKGEVGDDVTRDKSLRMNASSPGFLRRRSARQAKQPRRRRAD